MKARSKVDVYPEMLSNAHGPWSPSLSCQSRGEEGGGWVGSASSEASTLAGNSSVPTLNLKAHVPRPLSRGYPRPSSGSGGKQRLYLARKRLARGFSGQQCGGKL